MNLKKVIRNILVAELTLIIPLVAMIFSDEANWGLGDFIIAGILLVGVGIAYRLIISGVKSDPKRAAIGILLAVAMILIWVEMAVGLFGSPIAGS